ncbi:MAG: alkaline phosphatase family protein [Gammaproteobacteria bacterium]|nr:alkaline phosphatase family protein [Gammaproteobacteria bacterium]
MKIVSVFVLISVLFLSACVARPQPEPSLIVMISIDQMRPDRLNGSLPGGLGRLMRDGFVFPSATLDHGLTNTCPGHVVMSTGVNPARAGIAGNSYIDHETGGERYCVDDPGTDNTVLGTTETRSPNAITAGTIGDWLKKKSRSSKVFAVSAKDRAAITMAGKRGDGVFWFHRGTGRFTTSRYYGNRLPDYVADFNGNSFFEDGFGASIPERWLHRGGSYRPDDFQGEMTKNLRVSGHPLNTGEQRASQVYYSPYIDLATGELARRMLEAERLGQRGVTDLLAVSFSATDTVGHYYGPFSAESEDGLRRLDEEVGRFLDALDQAVPGNYLLVMSADHGVQPLPEWLTDQGQMNCPAAGGRTELTALGRSVIGFLIAELGIPAEQAVRLLGFSAAGITINANTAKALGLDVDTVRDALEAFLESQPIIKAAWTELEINTGNSEFARLYRNSFVPGKSGHLIPQTHENCLVWFPEGTTHGSPWLYDRAIPLVFYGRGVKKGVSGGRAHSVDIAPTLGAMLGLSFPDDLDGQIRSEILAGGAL